MDAGLLIARLVLAGVFTLAGVAKLSDLQGSRKAIIDFGVPSAIAAPLGLVLPLAELSVAATLLPASTAWWGALGALVLLSVFVVGITYNLARGRKPECHCFGQLHSAPAGWKTLARNGALAAVAGFILWEGTYGEAGPSALAWLGALSATQLLGLLGGVLLLALLAGQWWFLVHLLRQNGRLLVRIEALEESIGAGGSIVAPSQNGSPVHQTEGLPLGSAAPDFSLSGLHGETLTLDALRSSGKPVMLLFTDPGCGPCNAMLPEVGRWQEEHAQKLTLALLSRGEVEENKTKASEHGLSNVLVQKDWEVSESYEVRGTPSAVLISPDGKITSPVAGGEEGIRGLISYAVGGRAQLSMQPHQPQGQPCPDCGKVHAAAPTVEAAQKVGEEAPQVKLPDLEGNTVELADFGGQQTLVLFWNPGCGFCQQMLPELKEWESGAPKDAPRLVVVSAGSEEANKEMGLASPVLLDQNFAVGRAFGASGTPSAVLVDAQGKVASDIVVGAPAVLELAGAQADPDGRQ
jgi:peroxiredoxin/membrane associated rhomboid family serine protease